MAIQLISVNNNKFDMDAGVSTQDVVVTDGTVTVKVDCCVWNGDEDGDGLEGWFAEAIDLARAGYEGYTLV